MNGDSDLIRILRSHILEQQVRVLDDYLALPGGALTHDFKRLVAAEAVHAMMVSTNRFPLAERLARLGSEVVPEVRAEFRRQAGSSELRTLLAFILLSHGDREGVPALVAEIETRGEFRCLAATALTKAGILTHAPAMLDLLRSLPLGAKTDIPTPEQDETLTILRSVRALETELPEDLHARFSQGETPLAVREFVMTQFPSRKRGSGATS